MKIVRGILFPASLPNQASTITSSLRIAAAIAGALVDKMESPVVIGFWGGMALLISSITGPGLTTSLSS